MNRSEERPMEPTSRIVRYAIYIRNNVDLGQSAAFNSVRQQRESLRAFIDSRQQWNWAPPQVYEDIGYSAMNMSRPALTRLLADVQAGKIDCVVVNSLDRLARLPEDTEKLMTIFQQQAVTVWTPDGDQLRLNPFLSPFLWEKLRQRIAAWERT
jgi:site-specific DNA recombinase